MEYTDVQVIEKCLNGDKTAFSYIVDRYKNLVYSIILRMTNNKEEANDLAQEVFTKVFVNLAKYHDQYKFSTWLIKITTNHVIDYRRKKNQETVPIDEINYEPVRTSSPEDDYLKKEERNIINQAINTLPDAYKIPIILYHRHGLSYNEICETINEPLSKVKNRIFRGRKMLKGILWSKDFLGGVNP